MVNRNLLRAEGPLLPLDLTLPCPIMYFELGAPVLVQYYPVGRARNNINELQQRLASNFNTHTHPKSPWVIDTFCRELAAASNEYRLGVQ